ncbi:MAG: hypothetical protein Q7R62_00515 [bacterium]|nr:hypothetical protein [bacterium]
MPITIDLLHEVTVIGGIENSLKTLLKLNPDHSLLIRPENLSDLDYTFALHDAIIAERLARRCSNSS